MKEEPCILLGCALYTRCYDDVYEYILTHLKQKCPNIESRCLYIIDNDRNTLKHNYLSIFLPNLRIIHTWNYIFSELHAWLLQNGRTHADYQFYLAEIKSLLLCTDMKIFIRVYDRSKSNWTQEFRIYFEQAIFPLIDTDLGSWILKKYNLCDSNSGIQGLICEPMQTVSAQLRDWRESRIDSGKIVFYWLQIYFVEQLRKTYTCLDSNYTLKQPQCDKWAMKARTLNATHEMIKTLLPEQTVEHVRTSIIVSFAYHPHLSDKRSNEQQNLTSLPVKRLKTTAFGSTQQSYIITKTNTSDLKSPLLVTAKQSKTMTVSLNKENKSASHFLI
ncbi:unnamed protein product [Rotaria magnacalcarata]|uniref:Uncharacterized protein n=2 Tax=Rotaria magnacalcarata TaxID=392030 RepID=A0A816WXP6_9BILA|nr:unnamed protein product [Rotaria magnacalcarata]